MNFKIGFVLIENKQQTVEGANKAIQLREKIMKYAEAEH